MKPVARNTEVAPETQEGGLSALIEAASARLARGERVRRTMPGGGRLHVDRRLPFLCLHLRSPDAKDLGTDQLITGEAAYLVASGARAHRAGITKLTRALATALGGEFGAFAVIEAWSAANTEGPTFTLLEPPTDAGAAVVEVLAHELGTLRVLGRKATVARVPASRSRRYRPLLPRGVREELSVCWVGIEVAPVYRNPGTGALYPAVLRGLRTGLGRALRHALFAFARGHTTHQPKDFHALGRNAMVKAVWAVDARLAEISSSFDFLLSLNPVNTTSLFNSFRRSRFESIPAFRYKPLEIDPPVMKRALYEVPIERIEDPVVAALFREKQAELDRQITMLADRGSPRFLLGSQQLYGRVQDSLVRVAEEILERIPTTARGPQSGGTVSPEEICREAEREFARYRKQYPKFAATARVAEGVAGGLMVSRGHLLVSPDTHAPAARVDALLQHEVGTHLVTYYNGAAQRFRQLATGLAGYDELQEGLAVLAEFLVGGMTPARLRTLAARVVGTRALEDGASFVDTFRLLCRCGFSQAAAFNVALRIFRGGGLTKDMVYLRGFSKVVRMIERGDEIEWLFIGKIAAAHVPIVKELHGRGVLRSAPLTPRYLERPDVKKRLERLANGLRIYELVD